MKTCLIVTGGVINERFAAEYLKDRGYDCVIAADAGLEAAKRLGLKPMAAVGDFDTVERDVYAYYTGQRGIDWDVHRPEKDETDTELALLTAMNYGCDLAEVIGATGGRMDHTISNIHSMLPCLERGMAVTLVDEKNKIYLLNGPKTFRAPEIFGRYISFLPLTEEVRGITLEGFKYPLHNRNVKLGPSLMISNELAEAEGSIAFDSGILICVESRD